MQHDMIWAITLLLFLLLLLVATVIRTLLVAFREPKLLFLCIVTKVAHPAGHLDSLLSPSACKCVLHCLGWVIKEYFESKSINYCGCFCDMVPCSCHVEMAEMAKIEGIDPVLCVVSVTVARILLLVVISTNEWSKPTSYLTRISHDA